MYINDVDLHLHSKKGGGRDSLDQIINKISSSGIRTFSITDYNDISSAAKLSRMKLPEDVHYVTGVEYSCRCENGMNCNILGYGYNPSSPELIQFTQWAKKQKNNSIPTKDAIHTISAAGGIPVLAHGLGVKHTALKEYEFEDLMDTLKREGIKGLEVFYSDYDLKTSGYLFGIAKMAGLHITGGSDYKGASIGAMPGQLCLEGKHVETEAISIGC